jgi:16S rRNA U516 pseudouridylate synthase RsuA-like enzyme
VEVIKQGEDRTWLSVTLTEGRHRQVKRMCSQVGHPVLKLKRTHFGPLKLGRLPTGALRPLTAPEIKALKAEEAIQQKREPTEKERSRTKQST